MSSEQNEKYKVLINGEEQYSIWLEYVTVPAGWTEVGKQGSKQECLDYIRSVWTDMRPLSLRLRMAGSSQSNRN